MTCLVLACGLAQAGPVRAQEDYIAIEQRLDAGQMKATGLDQLSARQLELLNALLSEDRKAVVRAARDASADDSSIGPGLRRERVEATLKGEFRGWGVGTRFDLENGQQWRVIEGEYWPRKAAGSPKVVITPGSISGWYLQVEGHGPRAKVRPAD